MFRNVKITDPLLREWVNTKIPFFSDNPDPFGQLVVVIGTLSFLTLIAYVLFRVSVAEDVGGQIRRMELGLSRVFHSTLLSRLCLLWAAIVIPLIFYVNTKEHYWTAKHTTMLFSGVMALLGWLAVCLKVPRFKVPYAWPVALILMSATLSTLRAVNMAESIGYLFAIFGSAVFMFVASQVFSTSKRIHLFVVTLVGVGAVMSLYGLAQAYLLIPMEHVYAQDTRAPVSTIGNKNYAAYFLDLTMPLALALAATRRRPMQTLLALAAFFLCRWHFVLCDTRGGTISMSVSILLTIVIVGFFHRKRFRLLLYVVLIEPLLWAAMSVGSITYSYTQEWGKTLAGIEGKRAISAALSRAVDEDFRHLQSHITQWFTTCNESLLGIDIRLTALLSGFALALFLFWFLLKVKKDWTFHLGGAVLLAFLPFLFAYFTMPKPMPTPKAVNLLVREARHLPNREIAEELLSRYGAVMQKAADSYNYILLSKHQDVAAMFSLTLFVAFATFLLFRWYDRKEGWLPGFATIGAMGLWFVFFLALRSGGLLHKRILEGLFFRLETLWPVSMSGFHDHWPMLGLLISSISFLVFTLVSLFAVIWAMQYIPDTFSKERTREIANTGIAIAKGAGVVVLLIVLATGLFHPRLKRVRQNMIRTYQTEEEGKVTRALFAGAHTFFNTQAKVKGQTPDGAVGFRLEIYQGCLRKIRDNPILGIGPGNFKIIHPHPKYETALERRILGKEVLGRKAHNDFLEDAVENGFFGLLGMIWMFTTAGFLLFKSLCLIRPAKNSTDVFNNTITWGLAWSLITILMHAQFEAPLLQPASTYTCWMLFGVLFQLHRIQRRRTLAAEGGMAVSLQPVAVEPSVDLKNAHSSLSSARSTSEFELPEPKPISPEAKPFANPWINWPVVVVVVTVLTSTVLLRQFVGEMWLRWGMIFSERSVEKYGFVFQTMKKASEVYPQQMETNYILGRYCIDAVSMLYKPWEVKTRTDLYGEKERQSNQKLIERLREDRQLDVDKIQEYAQMGIDVHKRDIFMNPHYKWAHNNMGVLCDKLSLINADLAAVETDPVKRAEYLRKSEEFKEDSRNCYSKALEIDDLQVYALFNLGVGAFSKDKDFDLAVKYFERTLLADPRRGDVYMFISRCHLADGNLEGAIRAAERLYAWINERPSNRIEPQLHEDMIRNLQQVTRIALQQEEADLAVRAALLLTEEDDRCGNLPLLARATLDAGSPEQAIAYASESVTSCKGSVSADSVFVQCKASCLLGDTTGALQTLDLLMNSNAADAYRSVIESDTAFDAIRGSSEYVSLMKE